SMQSYVAATMVQLAKPYMIEDAKVLDPFVGTGTLLIERCFAKSAHFVMGIDVYGQGIESARKNAKLAGQNIYFVHKDSLRFVNNEMFDEIITDMPTFAQMKDQEQLQNLYDRFFERIRRLVKPGGYVFLYTSEISLVRKNLRLQEGYLSLEEHYEVPRGKNMFYFFIIKVK
ncbi:MAG: TRM11 family SAM-dependent methyltransferase, partial [Coprobacillus cateniformis]